MKLRRKLFTPLSRTHEWHAQDVRQLTPREGRCEGTSRAKGPVETQGCLVGELLAMDALVPRCGP